MRTFKGILLSGTAVLALMACAAEGPGKIGSVNDIVVRNAGEKAAPPPPDAVKNVTLAQGTPATDETAVEADAAPAAGEEPTSAEIIAAPDTGVPAAAQAEIEEKAASAAAPVVEASAPAAQTATAVDEATSDEAATAQAAAAAENQIQWNRAQRVSGTQSAATDAPAPAPAGEEAVAAPASAVEPAQPVAAQNPVPSAPPAADQQNAEQTLLEQAEAARAPAAPAPAAAEPAAMQLTRVDGPLPFDPSILQSKDPAKIKSLQKALKDDGYYKGPLDGVMTSDTLNAYVKYQTAANAAHSPVAAPAPTPAPAAVSEPVQQVQQVAPAPEPVSAPVEAPTSTTATAAPTPVADATPTAATPLMVSRRAPEPLPAVEGYTPSAVRPSVANATAAAAAAAAPAPSTDVVAAPAPSVQTAPAAPQVFTAATASPTNPDVIRAAQNALSAKGLYTGAATGAMDTATLNALVRFQAANKLTPGLLNVETLTALGVVSQ